MNIFKQKIFVKFFEKGVFSLFTVLSFVDYDKPIWYFLAKGNIEVVFYNMFVTKRQDFIDSYRDFSILCMTTKEKCKTKKRINNELQNEQQNNFISDQF